MEAGSSGPAVFVKEGQREGGGAFVARKADVELTHADVSQPQEVGRGRKQPCIY